MKLFIITFQIIHNYKIISCNSINSNSLSTKIDISDLRIKNINLENKCTALACVTTKFKTDFLLKFEVMRFKFKSPAIINSRERNCLQTRPLINQYSSLVSERRTVT